jgi:hypothetical protein
MSKSIDVPFSKTILVRDTCLCLHVQRAARALARRFDEALRPVGLTNGQFSLLMSLNRPAPPAMGSVASLLAMDRTTLGGSARAGRPASGTICGRFPDGDQVSGFRSPIIVGINSETVGWICTARWMVV